MITAADDSFQDFLKLYKAKELSQIVRGHIIQHVPEILQEEIALTFDMAMTNMAEETLGFINRSTHGPK